VSHNTLINRYWAQYVRCHKVHAEKLFPRSKTHPWMPGLWCKRCQAKIDRPPKAKVKKQRAAKPVTEEQTGVSREFLDKLAKTLLPPKRVRKPYVIPPSSTDPSKPRTRTEFSEEFGWFEFYLRDTLVGIGKTEKEALEDSVRRKGKPYSLVPDLKAAMGIEFNDHPDPAGSGNLREDAQSALRPNCASSRLEVGGVQDHADSEEATVTSLPAPSPTSPSTPSPASEPEKKDKASSAPASSVSKPPAIPLPANWQVAQERTGRWVVYEVGADGKYSTPIGFGRSREAAVADARATVKRAASFRAKWNKADPWE